MWRKWAKPEFFGGNLQRVYQIRSKKRRDQLMGTQHMELMGTGFLSTHGDEADPGIRARS
jgi:hypothetical protein